MTEQESLVILNAIPGLGNQRIKKLLHFFSSATRVLLADANSLKQSGIASDEVISNIKRFPQDSFLEKEYRLIKSQKVRTITFLDEDYPERLKEIPDCPVILYIRGNVRSLNQSPSIAIVGSRNASFYGASMAFELSAKLAGFGLNIVSGLARGIDTSSHRGALSVRGQTSAVLGSGLDSIYPPENKKLAEAILAGEGCLVSEFSMESPAARYHFPRRNRIVSGLSLGVIVVEASDKSGALITAGCALEQGREVFAVPGNITHPNSKGVHRLIKEGAKLVGSVEDILEELNLPLLSYVKQPAVPQNTGSKNRLNSTEEEIYRCLDREPIHIDRLAASCGQPISTVVSTLLRLELKKAVKQWPGKMFARVSSS